MMIETDMADWDRLPNGEIEIEHVAGWAVGASPRNVLLRLEILMATGQIGYAQLKIPADQAADLAKALAERATRALASEPPPRR